MYVCVSYYKDYDRRALLVIGKWGVSHTHTNTCIYLQDGNAMLWDLNEGKHLYTLNGGEVINTLVFSPNRYWLCAATEQSVKIWVSQLNIST